MNNLTLYRAFWALSFTLAVIASIYFILNLFERYWENPVIMSLTPTTIKLSDIPFPAVTICNMNNLRRSKGVNILRRYIFRANNLFNIHTKVKNWVFRFLRGSTLERTLLKDFCDSDQEVDKNDTEASKWAEIKQFMVNVRLSLTIVDRILKTLFSVQHLFLKTSFSFFETSRYLVTLLISLSYWKLWCNNIEKNCRYLNLVRTAWSTVVGAETLRNAWIYSTRRWQMKEYVALLTEFRVN
jgi:hypothetical protein